MTKRIIIKDGKKYIVNTPSWDEESELEQVNEQTLPSDIVPSPILPIQNNE